MPSTSVAVAKGLHLSLSFSYSGNRFAQAAPGPFATAFDGTPSLRDFRTLFEKLEWLVGSAEAVERRQADEEVLPDRVPELLTAAGRALPRDSTVLELRYASPVLLHVLLSVGSVPALGCLLYGAKRLFGIDLEFKSHRENKAAEYQMARARHIKARHYADAVAATERMPLPTGTTLWIPEGGHLSEDRLDVAQPSMDDEALPS